jgi:hypothetical protein
MSPEPTARLSMNMCCEIGSMDRSYIFGARNEELPRSETDGLCGKVSRAKGCASSEFQDATEISIGSHSLVPWWKVFGNVFPERRPALASLILKVRRIILKWS